MTEPYQYKRENPFLRVRATGIFMPHTEFYVIDQLLFVAKHAARLHLDGVIPDDEVFSDKKVSQGFLNRIEQWEQEWKAKD